MKSQRPLKLFQVSRRDGELFSLIGQRVGERHQEKKLGRKTTKIKFLSEGVEYVIWLGDSPVIGVYQPRTLIVRNKTTGTTEVKYV